MYETLMMLKPGFSFPPEKMEELVRDVCEGMPWQVTRSGDTITVQAGASSLEISFDDAPWVLEASAEIAEEEGLDCADCAARYEMHGEEEGKGLDLFNEALLICERLEDMEFVLLDPWRQEDI